MWYNKESSTHSFHLAWRQEMDHPSQITTRYDVVLASDEFKDLAQMCPEMSLAEEVMRGDGTVITGPEVLMSSEDDNEVKSHLLIFAKRSVEEKKHLAIIIRNFFPVGNSVGTRGQLIFLDTEKILAGGF